MQFFSTIPNYVDNLIADND